MLENEFYYFVDHNKLFVFNITMECFLITMKNKTKNKQYLIVNKCFCLFLLRKIAKTLTLIFHVRIDIFFPGSFADDTF